MASDKVEKEQSPAPVSKSTSYEQRWKTIQAEFAEVDGDEFKDFELGRKKSDGSEEGAAVGEGGDSKGKGSGDNKENVASGDKAGGDKASGDKASGDKASGDKASGDKKNTEKKKEKEEEEEVDDGEIRLKKANPEDAEMNQFNMPNSATFLTDMARYRQQNKLYVYPLTQEDLYNPIIVKLTTSDACHDYRVHFYRETTAEKSAFTGLLTMFFTSTEALESAMTEVKKIRDDLTVEQHDPKSQKKLVPLWNRKSKEAAASSLKENAVFLSNVPLKVTAERLQKFFPSSTEIILPTYHDSRNKIRARHGYAYAMYSTSEEVDAVVKQYETERPAIGRTVLGVCRYKEGIKKPHGLLSLTQRKLVLKHGAKAAAAIEKANSGEEEVKTSEIIKNKLKRCVELIEKDNEARKTQGLPTPSYPRIMHMTDLPALNSKETQKVLSDLKVIPPSGRRHVAFSGVPNNHHHHGGSVDSKKQQKRMMKKTMRRQGRRSLLGGMPNYMNMGYGGFGYYGNPYGFGGMGAGYGGYGMGGYGGNCGYNNKYGNQGANNRPLLDTYNNRGSYQAAQQTHLRGNTYPGLGQAQGTTQGRRLAGTGGLNQTNNTGLMGHNNVNNQRLTGMNQFNNYNNQSYNNNNNRQDLGASLYGSRYGGNSNGLSHNSLTAGGDSWYNGSYNTDRYF